jgi:CHRD domain
MQDMEGLSMNKVVLATGLAVALVFTAGSGSARERDHTFNVFAIMKAANEVPSISSPAEAVFTATIDEDAKTITYTLKYSGIATQPLFAHIHFGQFFANGGVSVFLCSSFAGQPPAAVPQPPACPASPATVSGVLTAANIVGPTLQGITGGGFDAIVDAIKHADAYANIHSVTFTGGEARGQILMGGGGSD